MDANSFRSLNNSKKHFEKKKYARFTEFYRVLPHFPVSAASNIIYLSAKCNNKSNEKQNALTVYLFEFLDMIHISEYSRVEIPQQWVVTP